VLSGPAILRISILLIIAGLLAAVVQVLLPSPAPVPVSPSTPPPAEVAESPAVVQPAPTPPAPPPVSAGADRGAAVQPQAAPPSATAAAPVQMPSDALAFPSDPAAPAEPQGQEAAGQAEVDRAEDSAGPRALAVVDLNTASVADLNRLRGGGAIGRAIVAKRPYASVDQLLSKRVLSRSVYERIKDQVTVR